MADHTEIMVGLAFIVLIQFVTFIYVRHIYLRIEYPEDRKVERQTREQSQG